MANFVEIDENNFHVEGFLNDIDIDQINKINNTTCLILKNTCGLSSELIAKVKNDKVYFSVKGGLDYEKINKYNRDYYKKRTYITPYALVEILKYFEKIESQIRPEWTDAQKAMFVYGVLAEDMDSEETITDGILERSLNGLLFGKLVCSGYALVYKEMMDRISINCFYHNVIRVHSYNVLELDGKFYGVDVTWDSFDAKDNEGECQFKNFGIDEDFYNRNGHQNYIRKPGYMGEFKGFVDSEEKRYNLSTFTKKEFEENYRVIGSYLRERSKEKYGVLNSKDDEVRKKWLVLVS